MNVRISISAAVAVFLASLSINSVVHGGTWVLAGLGAVIVVVGAGVLTRLSTLGAALAVTVCVLVAVVPLLSADAWPARTIGVVIAALTAASVTGRRWFQGFAAAAGYLALLLIYLNLLFANAASYWRIVPTYHSMTLLGQMVPQAFDQFKASPPVLDTPAVSLVAAAGIGLIAVIVDIIAVRLHRPALAGVPLLVLFCVPVASSLKTFGVAQTVIFVAALAGFLSLLSTDGRMRLRMWGRLVTFRYVQSADETGSGPDTKELAASGRRIGLAAVCLAVAIPVILPAVHGNALFGTSGRSIARGAGGLDPFLQIEQELTKRSAPVLSYKTTASNPAQQYFQVYVLNYSNSRGQWLPEIPTGIGGISQIAGPVLPYPPTDQLVATAAKVQTHVFMAPHQGSSLEYLPVPYYPVDLQAGGANLEEYAGSQMIFSPEQSLSGLSYWVTSRDANPSQGAVSTANQAVPGNIQGQYASYAGPDATRLQNIARLHTQGAVTALQQATDLQNWLKSKSFTYTVKPHLPRSHWLLRFLTTDRRGYCQHYAWAMAILARLLGIPSRIVIGYTAGSRSTGGRWQVMTDDAHAWPELYFAGQGWLRFEPTPDGAAGQGTATVPGYAKGRSTVAGATAPGASAQPHSSTGPTGPGKKNPVPNHHFQQGQQGVVGVTSNSAGMALGLLIGLPLLVVLLLGSPALARRLTRRRRWLAATGDAGKAHAAWRELTDELTDLAMPSAPGETPRAVADRVSKRPGFDPAAATALITMADAEERALYARRPAPGEGLAADLRVVRRAAAATATRRQRIRATLLPASTMDGARRLIERAGGLLNWLDVSWPALGRQVREPSSGPVSTTARPYPAGRQN